MRTYQRREKLKLNLICIYVRKSRGDKDKDVLVKHRRALLNYAKILEVPYVIKEEIGTSDSIEYRPVFKKLLEEVREGTYDAVLVMKADRLSRGDWKDVATYREAFKESNTLVLTPSKVIDYSDEEQELENDVEALLAKNEYQKIKERFREGKINGVHLKQWVNGPAPFPYLYSPEKKGLVVNKEELFVYDMMKNDYINGLSFQAIAYKLNNLGLLTRRQNNWSSVTVERTLFNEVHLGRIIYGKTTGSGHKNKKTKPLVHNSRDEWLIIENCHEAVKTLEEHQQMLVIRENRQKVSKPARSWKFALSGILYCGKCGYAMRTNRKLTKKGESSYIVKCQKKDSYGHKCGNPGVDSSIIILAIESDLKKYLNEFTNMEHVYDQSKNKISSLIDLKEKSLQETRKKIERINDGFNNGFYNIKEAKMQKLEQDNRITQLEAEIAELRENESEYKGTSRAERKKQIEEILTNLNDSKIKVSELNRLLRLIIDQVSYVRNGEEIDIDIQYL